MPEDNEHPSNWPLVISLHGIRTTGNWQKELTGELILQKFSYEPLDFGFFGALFLLLPWSRSKKVEWFHEKYSELAHKSSKTPSLIAHSFGTYIAAKAMLKYSDIKFDKIILCGSIISVDYPWSDIILKREQVDSVLNEAGGQDIWSELVSWVVEDAGASGVTGFTDTSNDSVKQRLHTSHRHSDYFYSQNYRESWIPFLKGNNPKEIITARKSQKNWKFYITLTLALTSCILGYLHLSPDWLPGKQYHELWYSKKNQGYYPISIDGKCTNDTEYFASKWAEIPPGAMFYSYSRMTKSFYDQKRNLLLLDGYELKYENKFMGCDDTLRYQTIWLKPAS